MAIILVEFEAKFLGSLLFWKNPTRSVMNITVSLNIVRCLVQYNPDFHAESVLRQHAIEFLWRQKFLRFLVVNVMKLLQYFPEKFKFDFLRK